jgi:phospholipase/carboxylesterase
MVWIGSLKLSVQNNTELISFQDWTLRVRPAQVLAPRLLLLLHGWTGDENSLWVFVRNFSEDYWIVAPRAPYFSEQPAGGYSWRPLRPENRAWPSLNDLRPSAEALIPLIDAYSTENNIDASQFDVMGFSQGGALTNVITLLHPERIRRAGILAGFLPADSEPLLRDKPLKGKPFFVAHGRLDETVKVEYAHQSVKSLEMAGAEVTFCEDDVGHKVSAPCLRGLEDFFARSNDR